MSQDKHPFLFKRSDTFKKTGRARWNVVLRADEEVQIGSVSWITGRRYVFKARPGFGLDSAQLDAVRAFLDLKNAYQTLPVRDERGEDGSRFMASAWEPTPEELRILNRGGALNPPAC